jgi:hypothetical protein
MPGRNPLCEVEYIALSEVTREAMWLWKLRPLVGLPSKGPVPIHYVPIECDNQGALALAEHDASHRRSKHIAIKYHLVRELVDLQEVQLHFEPV